MEPAVILTQVSVQTWMNIYYQMNWSCISVWWAKEDGVNYDHVTRECRITQTASLLSWNHRFLRICSIFTPEELNDFAIDCCRQQIYRVYGDRSLEMLRFEQAVGVLS